MQAVSSQQVIYVVYGEDDIAKHEMSTFLKNIWDNGGSSLFMIVLAEPHPYKADEEIGSDVIAAVEKHLADGKSIFVILHNGIPAEEMTMLMSTFKSMRVPVRLLMMW